MWLWSKPVQDQDFEKVKTVVHLTDKGVAEEIW